MPVISETLCAFGSPSNASATKAIPTTTGTLWIKTDNIHLLFLPYGVIVINLFCKRFWST